MDTTALIDFLIEAGDFVTDPDIMFLAGMMIIPAIILRGWYRAWREEWPSAPVDDDRSELCDVNPATGAPMVSEGFDALGNAYGFGGHDHD
jgi:hypothetical protein